MFALFVCIGLTISCASRKNTVSATETETRGVPATVIDYRELDGCEFLLALDDGRKLQPVNLDKKFLKNGLKVHIQWKNYNGVSICMAGTMVELTYIRLTEIKP